MSSETETPFGFGVLDAFLFADASARARSHGCDREGVDPHAQLELGRANVKPGLGRCKELRVH